MIPRFKPELGVAELRALLGPHPGAVAHLEQGFARKFGAAEAVAFPYGRSALWAMLQAVGVHDAEVIVPAYTCSVVAYAVSMSGNRPRFVDIRLDDYNMDLDLLAAAIGPATRAVVATHLFGYPLDLDRLTAIVADAERRWGHKIWLIQDCAHAFGATWRGRLVGQAGDAALYALNVSKMMTSIFGGMLTFSDPELAASVRRWRDAQFRQPSWRKPWFRRLYLAAAAAAFTEPVYGLTWWLQERTPWLDRLTRSYHLDDQIAMPPDHLDRMLDVEAAVGLVQLERYDAMIARRRANAAFLDENLRRRAGWVLPPIVEGATYSHYVVRVPDRAACVAAAARQRLHLGELIQYSAPQLAPYGHATSEHPNADLASRSTINVPVDAACNEARRGHIVAVLNGLAP
ncbi:MAG: DegT/DnrJ/EryC1/StrS family aminotransferase [Burkholderiaceae bacterium]|nr:DegT/DnrJ/EryC1/StrS family aminotransferase [Burkholderiaceae bacterium]